MTFNYTNEQIIQRKKKLDSMEVVDDEDYDGLIPKEMEFKFLSKIYFDTFGVDVIDIFLSRKIIDAKSILISDFATNGFFWAQLDEEAKSDEYSELYEFINIEAHSSTLEMADLKKKWCIAKFDKEWFRAYIYEKEGTKLKVFFIDYGTFSVVDHTDTRQFDRESIWAIPPLAIPFVLKGIPAQKLNKFKKLQYEKFNVKEMKPIKNNCIFEVELTDDNNNNIISLL